MKNMIPVSILSVWALINLAGCGGGSGSTCGSVAPCGGSLVGTWSITSSCLTASASMFSDQCPTATATGSKLTITGAATYKADLTFVSNSTVSGSVTVNLPASCLTSGGLTLTCAQLTQALAGSGTFDSANCASAGSGCACTVGMNAQTSTDMGTYATTSAGLLTETSSDGSVNLSDYCVKGSTLTLSPHNASSMMGQAASGSITATKQ